MCYIPKIACMFIEATRNMKTIWKYDYGWTNMTKNITAALL